jgi:L,D-transpeptidase catalytic domain
MTGSGKTARRSRGLRRGTMGLAAAGLAVVISCTVSVPRADSFESRAVPSTPQVNPSVSRANRSRIPVGQALVILLQNKVPHTAPSASAPELTTVASHRPLTGIQTVLPVLGHAGGRWLHVRLPGRPNSGTGWITTAGSMPSWTPWRLSVNLGARLVTVYYRGQVTKRFSAIVGKPSTPTPTGQFFIEEGESLSADASGAPYALATSARSNVLMQFDGGPGQVAIHGTDNIPGAIGTASSHGCIRLNTTNITWLAMRIGPGVPLTILK